MSTAQRRSATKSRRTAAPKKEDVVQAEAVAERARAADSTSRPPKPAPVKEIDPDKPRSKLSLRMERIRKLILDTWSEIKKISWPDGDTVRRLTALVLVMAIALGLLLGGIDYVLLKVFDALT
jgi:preprotein translocase SecE subunit